MRLAANMLSSNPASPTTSAACGRMPLIQRRLPRSAWRWCEAWRGGFGNPGGTKGRRCADGLAWEQMP